jgi:hypothetical protein
MSQKGEYILRHQRKSHNLICTSNKNSVLVQDMLHANETRKIYIMHKVKYQLIKMREYIEETN